MLMLMTITTMVTVGSQMLMNGEVAHTMLFKIKFWIMMMTLHAPQIKMKRKVSMLSMSSSVSMISTYLLM